MPTTKANKKVKQLKGGKGKKDSKHESKGSKQSDAETPGANVALWELRLKATSQDLAEYRKSNLNLERANAHLSDHLRQAEQSSVDKTGSWWREVEAKEDNIIMLEESLKRRTKLADEEKSKLVGEINLIGYEKSKTKARKAQMEQEISDIKKSKEIADLEYRENVIKMEERFLKEKTCLAREKKERYNQQIALLKLEQHQAIEKLKSDSLKKLEKLNEPLRNTIPYHTLEECKHAVTEKKISLAQGKEMLELTINENKAKLKDLNGKISKLRAKLASLEEALALKAWTLEQMKKEEEMELFTVQTSQVELANLKKVVIMQQEEIQKAKQLVRTIEKMSKDPEKFFHEALEDVKRKIAASTPRSHPPGSEVQLTWEQKEQVLELLFAKMNGERERIREELCPATISPQAPETILPSTPNSRPDEHTT